MKIRKLAIHNYRNLDGVEIALDPELAFLVGENNLGKSNLLDLLNSVFLARQFEESDFKDAASPIEVSIELQLSQTELGIFDDVFDLKDPSIISIALRQEDPDSWIELHHAESGIAIDTRALKVTQFVLYDSQRKPERELDFSSNFGVAKVLRHFVSLYERSRPSGSSPILDETQIKAAIEFVNDRLSRIRSFRDYGYSASWREDFADALSRVIHLRGLDGLDMASTGYGLKYFTIVTLAILERLLVVSGQRLNRSILEEKKTGKRTVTMILAFDEPEIHLHPHLQRSLVDYLSSILSNRDAAFLSLVKELFDIDEFSAQLIVVTHSPYILRPSHQQISRLALASDRIVAFSGPNLLFDAQQRKHFAFQFEFIKEAFFSRGTLVVEGETELGALPRFARSLGIDIDRLGVSIVRAASKNSAKPLCSVLEAFGIPCFALTDRDDAPAVNEESHSTTDRRDLEEEVVEALNSSREDLLCQIVTENDPKGPSRKLDGKMLLKTGSLYRPGDALPFVEAESYSLESVRPDASSRRAWYLSWLRINKGLITGAAIGETIPRRLIPYVYRKALLKFARKIVREVRRA